MNWKGRTVARLRHNSRVQRSIQRLAELLAPPPPTFSEQLMEAVCKGVGVEVGPGRSPYAPLAIQVDKFERFATVWDVKHDVRSEGDTLPFRSACLDYLVASHVLEHHHDARAALEEWTRVLSSGGRLVLVLPHMHRIWDRGRTPSTLDRLVAGEDHWREFEEISIPAMTANEASWKADPRSQGERRREWLTAEGIVHWHAWGHHEMVEILEAMDFAISMVVEELPDRYDSFLVIARRP